MLVLTRRIDEWIDIPAAGISICVCEITPHKVRIGIKAPHDDRIYRRELLARVTGVRNGTHHAGGPKDRNARQLPNAGQVPSLENG